MIWFNLSTQGDSILLENKVILITGSTTGIGRATAEHCIAAGAQVMVHGRNEDRAKELAETLGERASYFIADIAEQAECEALIAATVDHFGRLDGLINNAGIFPRTTIDSFDHDMIDRIFATNMKAPLFLSQAAIAVFRKQPKHDAGRGTILNIGSINAHCGQPDLLIYSMSKGALMTMTRNLADALGHEGIRINCLNVGWTATETEIALKRDEGLPDNWQDLVPPVYAPSGRVLSPEDDARHAVFWVSDQSFPANGVVYEVEQYPMIGRNRICDLNLGGE